MTLPRELVELRDHARAMAVWVDPRTKATKVSAWCDDLRQVVNLPDHERCPGRIGALSRFRRDEASLCACACHPIDPGPTERDRVLWEQIADEIDLHHADQLGLFKEPPS